MGLRLYLHFINNSLHVHGTASVPTLFLVPGTFCICQIRQGPLTVCCWRLSRVTDPKLHLWIWFGQRDTWISPGPSAYCPHKQFAQGNISICLHVSEHIKIFGRVSALFKTRPLFIVPNYFGNEDWIGNNEGLGKAQFYARVPNWEF